MGEESLKRFHSPVGLRTVKTALAVCAALFVVEQYGTSADKMVFAVMGAVAAMEPTIKASLRSSGAQIISVVLGVLLSIVMRLFELPSVFTAGVGVILVMMMYHVLHWRASPLMPCLILMTIGTNPELSAVSYGLARIWDTAIGLTIGMLVNMLVFPYDNSKQIRQTMAGLDEDLIVFLEDMFDGDEHLPETEAMTRKIDSLEHQLALFADQRLFRRRRQKRLLSQLQGCGDLAQALLTEVQTLRNIEHVGRLNRTNRERLRDLGAKISVEEPNNRFSVEDLVVNYHMTKALELREQLKEELSKNRWKQRG